MKLAIVGSRDFNNYDLLSEYVDIFLSQDITSHNSIISGGARGADALAKEFVEKENSHLMFFDKIKYTEFPADWNKYGKSAGFRRNQQIVDACDMVLAFWDGVSKGTQDTINKAKKAKKPTFIIYF